MKNLVLKELRWSNAFSYGEDNVLQLNKNRLTQVMGVNGAGKTSIPMILTEALYGQNLRKIKKEKISNWNVDKKGYIIEVDFTDGISDYTVKLDRKSSLKLILLKDGEDISEHRGPDTYKKIDEIFAGLGYKAVLPLIYQSTKVALDFLTATDKGRKDFLLSLLQQEKYKQLYEHFRITSTSAKKELSMYEGRLSVHQEWLDKYADFDFSSKQPVEVEDLKNLIEDLKKEINALEIELKNIKDTNRSIAKNEEIKKQLNSLSSVEWPEKPKNLVSEEEYNSLCKKAESIKNITSDLEADIRSLEKNKRQINSELKKFGKGICATCGQEVDQEHLKKSLADIEEKISTKYIECVSYNENLSYFADEISEYEKYQKYLTKAQEEDKRLQEKEQWLLKTVDSKLPTELFDPVDLDYKIKDKKSELSKVEKELNNSEKFNKEVQDHNSKITYVASQFAETEGKMEEASKEVDYWNKRCNVLNVIKEAFGTKGLVTYKIESSVKKLEKEINVYLRAISDYQMYFYNENDKLKIKVIDSEENEIEIDSFSTGELGRINIATLLGIRKMMSEISGVHINFLFLDEIVGVLDDEGRETLAETLLNEEGLNTFMVAHGTDVHPLAEKVFVKKKGKISNIKDG